MAHTKTTGNDPTNSNSGRGGKQEGSGRKRGSRRKKVTFTYSAKPKLHKQDGRGGGRGGARGGSVRKRKADDEQQNGIAISEEDVPQQTVEVEENADPERRHVAYQWRNYTHEPRKRMRISDLTFAEGGEAATKAKLGKSIFDLEDSNDLLKSVTASTRRSKRISRAELLDDSDEDELAMPVEANPSATKKKTADHKPEKSAAVEQSHHQDEWVDEPPSKNTIAPTRKAKSGFFCDHEGCPRSTGRGLNTQAFLDRHKLIHSPSVVCEWNGCNKVFSRIDNMRDHVKRIHTKNVQQEPRQQDDDTIIDKTTPKVFNGATISEIQAKTATSTVSGTALKPLLTKAGPIATIVIAEKATIPKSKRGRPRNNVTQTPLQPEDATPTTNFAPTSNRKDAQVKLQVMKLQGQASAWEAEAKKIQADASGLRTRAEELESQARNREVDAWKLRIQAQELELSLT